MLTSGDLHVRDRLPLVHGDEPCLLDASAAEVDDKLGLVVVEAREDALEVREGEGAGGEEEGGYDDLRSTYLSTTEPYEMGSRDGAFIATGENW